MDRPIFLIGFMCSGKTTLGKAVARVIGVPFIDLDDEVERLAGKTVSAIFAEDGEPAFRQLEADALRIATREGAAIVACGGGTPCRPGAVEWMSAIGDVVYLRPHTDRLVARLMDGRGKRPLIASISSAQEMRKFAEAKLAEREKFYHLAPRVFDSSYLDTPEEIRLSVEKFVKAFIK